MIGEREGGGSTASPIASLGWNQREDTDTMARDPHGATEAFFEERFGHHWKEMQRVQEYIARLDRQDADRADGFRLMVALIPFDIGARLRVLDVGAGQGSVAACVLDAFPHAEAIGLDISEPMMAAGRERMARFGPRFRYHVGDFADGKLPDDLERPFDVVVSSRAIHHLPADLKRSLYRSIHDALNPGGCFFNLDMVSPGDDYLRALYRQATRFLNGEVVDRSEVPAPRPNSPGHFFETVGETLGFLAEAGFSSVDCPWKRLNSALVAGYKRR